jgi:phosphohistidine swiveling domain-containing protein
VRSSGLREDGKDRSFAGVFESVLDVSEDRLGDAVQTVQRSFAGAAATRYAVSAETGGIIVQEMIDAEWAGVLFTRHPEHGGQALIEMIDGVGEALVSGGRTPRSYCAGRRSGILIGDVHPPIDVAPLLALGRKAEKLFGRPQDIEWAYKGGRFYILQSRDITRVRSADAQGRIEAERARLLDLLRDAPSEGHVLIQSEMSELVPRPTPATLSLLESFWQPGGSVDLASRRLGLAYDVAEDGAPYLVSAFGNLYVNAVEEKRRMAPISAFATFRLARLADKVEARFRGDFLRAFLKRMAVEQVIDPSRLRDAELFALLREVRRRFVTETYVEASMVNLLAALYGQIARKELSARGLRAESLMVPPETIASALQARLPALPPDEARRAFVAEFGHRAALDYELGQARYGEDARIADFALGHLRTAPAPRHGHAPTIALDRRLAAQVARATRFQALKEDAKHYVLREVAVLRRLIVAVGERTGLGDDIFQLTLDEIESLVEPARAHALAETVRERRDDAAAFAGVLLPVAMTLSRLETLELGAKRSVATGAGLLKGTLVSGAPPVEGRARVVTAADAERGTDLGGVGADEIVVSRFIHPNWLTEITGARGLLCEVGGWLSHTAILAREYDLPMIVGIEGIEAIGNGDRIRLHPDGTIERLS